MSPVLARQAFGDRVSRAFLLKTDPARLAEFWRQLEFNALLATELREAAVRAARPTIWETST